MKRVIYRNEIGDEIRVNYPVNFAVSPYLYAIGGDEKLNDLVDIIEAEGDAAFRSFCVVYDRKEATEKASEFVSGLLSSCGFEAVR